MSSGGIMEINVMARQDRGIRDIAREMWFDPVSTDTFEKADTGRKKCSRLNGGSAFGRLF